jgi:hypothetical protein
LGGVVALLGVGLFALPAGIIGSGFVEIMYEENEAQRRDQELDQQRRSNMPSSTVSETHGERLSGPAYRSRPALGGVGGGARNLSGMGNDSLPSLSFDTGSNSTASVCCPRCLEEFEVAVQVGAAPQRKPMTSALL